MLIIIFQTYNLLNIKEGGGLGGDELIWTKKKVLKEALKFKKRVDFKHYSRGAYMASIRGKYYSEATKHMKYFWKFKWSKKKVFQDALKYQTRSEWARNSRSYDAAQTNGWLQDASKHMRDGNIFWTKKKVLKEALKYKKRIDFQKKSNGAYNAAHRIGCYHEATKHMKKLKNQFR